MKTVKTDKSYKDDVRKKYINDKENGIIGGDLRNLTPGGLKKICLNSIDRNLSVEDRRTIEKFFELKSGENLLVKIKKYDIDCFRPICRFLRKKTETIQQHYAIELIAIIIDFNPRPYNRYYKNELDEKVIENEDIEAFDTTINYISENEANPDIIVKSKNKKIFAWYSSASAMNKISFKIIIATILIVTTTLFTITINSKPNWMIWKDDHYEKVNFNLNKYDFNQLKLYQKDRILNFKLIEANCDTTFFKEDGSENIWYGKNKKGKLEYFTGFGLHPETAKTLKKITKHMIKKYICETY